MTEFAEDDRDATPIFQRDVIAWRLGQVERQADHTEKNLAELTKLVTAFVAEMPAKYVPRAEHERVRSEQRVHTSGHLSLLIAAGCLFNGVLTTLISLLVGH